MTIYHFILLALGKSEERYLFFFFPSFFSLPPHFLSCSTTTTTNLSPHIISWCQASIPIIQTLIQRGKGKRARRGQFDAGHVAMGLNTQQRETERIEKILDVSYSKHVTAPSSILAKQVSLEDLLVYPNKRGHGPFHVACGSCAAVNEDAAPLGAHSLPVMMKGNATMGDKEEGLSSRESLQFERKRERLSILEHLFTTYNTPLSGTKTLDPNARTSPNGMAGLHYVARAARSGGEGAMHDAHLDEKTVRLY